MKCDKCRELGLVSTIRRTSEGWITTAHRHPFTDDEGREHHHKVEITRRDNWCTRGHYFETRERYMCWCGWPNKKS